TADNPTYSPDGSTIVLAWNHQLATVPAAGGVAGLVPLPVPPGTTTDAPSFSPDGTHLAFQTNLGDGYGEIATAAGDGSDFRFPSPNTTGGLMATDLAPSWGLRS